MNTPSPVSIDEPLRGIIIPPQPKIINDLLTAQANPNCEAEDIAVIVEQDIGLAGSILKTVNSPYFGLKNTISNIKQAVSLLGIANVTNIANGLALKKTFSDETGAALEEFWKVSNATANIATAISKQLGIASTDLAYSLGLFHNCGIPLMAMKHQDYFSVLEEAYHLPDGRLVDTENKHYKANHAVVGFYTAKAWHLPDALCDVIAEHHSLEKHFGQSASKEAHHTELVALLKMAEHIAKTAEILGHASEDLEWQHYGHRILEFVGLSEDDFHEMEVSINGY